MTQFFIFIVPCQCGYGASLAWLELIQRHNSLLLCLQRIERERTI